MTTLVSTAIVVAIAGQAQAQPDDATRFAVRGDSLLRAVGTDRAIAIYRAGLEAHPDDPELGQRLAFALVSRAQETPGEEGDEALLKEAVSVASHAVRNGPRLSRAYSALSVALGRYAHHVGHAHRLTRARDVIDLGRQAKQAADYALMLDPDDFAPHAILGVWHRELSTVHPIAKAVARRFLGGYPEVSLDESERYLSRAVELAPDRVAIRLQIARTYVAMEDTEKAREHLNAALRFEPAGRFEAEEQRIAREMLERLS